MPGLIRFWPVKLFCALVVVLLAGCSAGSGEVYSQKRFQQLVDTGFPAPRIVTLGTLPLMVVQLYLDTPRIFIQGDGQPLMFHISGKVDAEVFGGLVTEKLPVQISGLTRLRYSPQEQAIYLDQIEFMEARIDLEVALLKALVVDSFHKALLQELVTMPLILLEKTPGLATELEALSKKSADGQVQFDAREGSLVIKPLAGQR